MKSVDIIVATCLHGLVGLIYLYRVWQTREHLYWVLVFASLGKSMYCLYGVETNIYG
jgi:hypothetical protein